MLCVCVCLFVCCVCLFACLFEGNGEKDRGKSPLNTCMDWESRGEVSWKLGRC